ncbi:SDR family NAD(P)-dependent oxidoreductase [Aeromicrobium sp. UC242_57]|uniref:SDR family NAD(P)-dependent oxidoreductase n=1 Tax=Aeromicrobium sp. UC242_57 TaxID=3374624 RepID=UPI0037A2FD00
MVRFDGKVVFISGVARGQGRSHAVAFAKEGASIIGIDLCRDQPLSATDWVRPRTCSRPERLVRAAGGLIVTTKADVRDFDQIRSATATGVEAFGGIDIVVANAAVLGGAGPLWEIDEDVFHNVIETNLIGVWKTLKATIPEVLKREGHRSVVVTSSGAGVKGSANIGDYVASKHGLLGLVKTLARELGPHGVRPMSCCPATSTPRCSRTPR